MRRLRLLVVLISLVALATGAAPVSADRGSWNNWHVHDGTVVPYTDASGLTHRGFVFFPQIWASYATDPTLWAYCTDATDKALVGGDGGSKGAAGHCQNDLYIIHLQINDSDAPAPAGWTGLTPSGGFTVYYHLTAR